MRPRSISMLAATSALLFAFASAGAQVVPAPQAPPATSPRRAQLEQQLRQRTGEVVKRRLALSDDQMSKLQATNRRFEPQRADLLRRERETRQALRAELLSGDSANQSKVSQLLDDQLQLQRQRIDLVQSEQRELGKFMTPVQRAKYVGVQAEIRKRAQALRMGQAEGGLNNTGGNRPLAGLRRQARRGVKQ